MKLKIYGKMEHLDQEQKITRLFQEINPKPSYLDEQIMQQILQDTTQIIIQKKVYYDIFKPIIWYSIVGLLTLIFIFILGTISSYIKIDTLSWTIFLAVLFPFSIDFYIQNKKVLSSK